MSPPNCFQVNGTVPATTSGLSTSLGFVNRIKETNSTETLDSRYAEDCFFFAVAALRNGLFFLS